MIPTPDEIKLLKNAVYTTRRLMLKGQEFQGIIQSDRGNTRESAAFNGHRGKHSRERDTSGVLS